jgi:hypothetical protein
VSYTFAAAPIVWCALLYSFILHWRVFHGTWPMTGTKRTTIAIQPGLCGGVSERRVVVFDLAEDVVHPVAFFAG